MYNETADTRAYLKYEQMYTDNAPDATVPFVRTISYLMDLGEKLLRPLIMSEQTLTMCADVLKAFGTSIIQPTQISEDYRVEPIYDKMVLSQIENASVLSLKTFKNEIRKSTGINNSHLYQNASATMYLPSGSADKWNWEGQFLHYGLAKSQMILNFHEEITPSLVIDATRFTCIPYGDATGNNTTGEFEIVESGTEIVCTGAFYYFNQLGGLTKYGFGELMYTLQSDVNLAMRSIGFMTSLWSAFDWAPQIRLARWERHATDGWYVGEVSQALQELDNFTIISTDQLNELHTLAKVGLFYPRNLGNYGTL